jgi:hypothetical protein
MYLIGQIAEAKTIGSVAACLNCLACELRDRINEDIAVRLLIYCFTSVLVKSPQLMRELSRVGTIPQTDYVDIFIRDKVAALGLFLRQCVVVNKKRDRFVIRLDELSILSERLAAGTLYVPITGNVRLYDRVELHIDHITKNIQPEWGQIVRNLIATSVNRETLFPINIRGRPQLYEARSSTPRAPARRRAMPSSCPRIAVRR